MLVRGARVMRDFAVPESVVSAPVFADFFSFFYQLMALVGVLTVLFGQVTRERWAQLLVARVFCAATSDWLLRLALTFAAYLVQRQAGDVLDESLDVAGRLARAQGRCALVRDTLTPARLEARELGGNVDGRAQKRERTRARVDQLLVRFAQPTKARGVGMRWGLGERREVATLDGGEIQGRRDR
jgi:hypothetical protein